MATSRKRAKKSVAKKRTQGKLHDFIPILTELAGNLAESFCTNEEMAAQVSRETGVGYDKLLEALETDAGVIQAVKEGGFRGQVAIRKKQLELATSGDKNMLTLLGKNHLGQNGKPSEEPPKKRGRKSLKDMM